LSERIPPISGIELIKLLAKWGIRPVRQRGSHVQLKGECNGVERYTTVPVHRKDLPNPTLNQILKDCGISREAFLKKR